MLLLLQETLEYLENQHKALQKLDGITVASRRKYKNIGKRISREIIKQLQRYGKQNSKHQLSKCKKKHHKTNEDKPVGLHVKQEPQEEYFTYTNSLGIGGSKLQNNAGVKKLQSTTVHSDNGCESRQENTIFKNKQLKETLKSPELPVGIIVKAEIPDDFDEYFQDNGEDNNADVVVNKEKLESVTSDPNRNQPQVEFFNENKLKCRVCNIIFDRYGKLTQHYRTCHTVQERYRCHICQKSLVARSSLTMHMLTHTGEKPHKCTICQESFRQSHHLQSHMSKHTGEIRKKTHQCEFCKRFFARPSDVKSHMLVHSDIKPFKCEICGVAYRRSEHLRMHMYSHTGEKPFKCKVCGKGFARQPYLRTHMYTHTGERPHKCNICGKGFTQPTHLNIHVQSMHAHRFKCDNCGVGFSSQNLLQLHMRIHTGEEQYKCKICDKVYLTNEKVRAHQRKVHKINGSWKIQKIENAK